MRREAKASASGDALTVRGEVRGRGVAARYRLALFGLLGLALLPLASASPAAAALKYQQSGNFTNGFNFLINNSVAVNDHNGHIYVADSGASNVQDFASPSDTSPAIWEGSNTPHGFFGGHVSVAADNSNGDVYVADGNHRAIVKFDENGNLITGFGDGTPGQLTGTATTAGSFSPNVSSYSSWGIAVDQANHDLYVLDGRNRAIDIFDQNGVYPQSDHHPGRHRPTERQLSDWARGQQQRHRLRLGLVGSQSGLSVRLFRQLCSNPGRLQHS